MISLRVVIPFRNFCGSKWKSNAKRLTSFSACSSFNPSSPPPPFSQLSSSCTCLTWLRGWAYRPDHERNTSNHVSGSIFKKVTVTKISGTFEVTRDSRDFSSIDIHGTVSTGEKKKKEKKSFEPGSGFLDNWNRNGVSRTRVPGGSCSVRRN